jgi:pimeloyl-ACP methyl ester carboxylesterase
MNLSFVSFPATDKVVLPALLYTPDKPTKKATVWLHGMGDNAVFYKPKLINELAEAHTSKNVAFLAFNNRGAHGSKRLKIADEALPEEDRGFPGGTHYELISDAPKDIDGAVAFMKQQGFDELYLAGHSTGANKICVYDDSASSNPFRKYVLAGTGDDTGMFFRELGAKRFWKAAQQAAKLVSQGKDLDIMPKYSGMYPFSAQSAWDILNPDGAYNTFPFYEHAIERIGQKPLFKEFKAISIPTLTIIGELDEYTSPTGAKAALDTLMGYTPSAMLKQHDFELVRNADHSFHDHETDFAEQMTDWLIRG